VATFGTNFWIQATLRSIVIKTLQNLLTAVDGGAVFNNNVTERCTLWSMAALFIDERSGHLVWCGNVGAMFNESAKTRRLQGSAVVYNGGERA
jgi:hypothetical protein